MRARYLHSVLASSCRAPVVRNTPRSKLSSRTMNAKPRFSLTSLLRLWVLREVRPDPTPSGFFLICLCLVWLLLWVTIDCWEALPDPQFLLAGVPLLAWYALAIL